MICIKCFKRCKGIKSKGLPGMLSHLAKYTVCDNCDDTGKYAKDYYTQYKEHYRELHKTYKKELTDSYVANTLVDRTELKAKDMPKELISAKREYMKLNRLIKEKSWAIKKVM